MLTRVHNFGRWIIYTESKRKVIEFKKKYNHKGYKLRTKQWLSLTKLTKPSSIPAQNVYAHLNCFAHFIHSSPLWSSEKWTVQHTQSASCSYSVESSLKRSARSVSESDRVSDRDGYRQTLLLHIFAGTKYHSTQQDWFWICLSFLSCPNKLSVKWTRYFLCCCTTNIWL